MVLASKQYVGRWGYVYRFWGEVGVRVGGFGRQNVSFEPGALSRRKGFDPILSLGSFAFVSAR